MGPWAVLLASPQTPTLPAKKQVFFACSYSLYPPEDYRRFVKEAGKPFAVTVEFADERLTNAHILDKIRGMIRDSAIAIFDVTDWNANVTLELGIAMGENRRWFLAFNPEKAPNHTVPSDIAGYGRIQYTSLTELQNGLEGLFAKEFLPPVPEDPLRQLEEQTLELLRDKPGLGVGDLAKALKQSPDVIRLIVQRLLDAQRVGYRGETRGRKYYPAPPVAVRPAETQPSASTKGSGSSSST